MKISVVLLGFSAIILYITPVDAWAPEATCKEFIGILTKKQLGGISTCSKSMKFKNPKDKATKMTCILRCVLINEKMLNADGSMVTGDKFDTFLGEWVPVNLKDLVIPRLTVCQQAAGDLTAADDEMCKNYDPLIKCMLDMVATLCK